MARHVVVVVVVVETGFAHEDETHSTQHAVVVLC